MAESVKIRTVPGKKGGIYYEHWCKIGPKFERRGIIIHGLGEHCGRYHTVIKAILHSGAADSILIWDQPGHGRSAGRRGDIEGGVSGYAAAAQTLLSHFLGPVRWVWGHSLGALVAVALMANCDGADLDAEGMILSGLPIVLGIAPSKIERALLPFLLFAAPGLRLSSKIKPAHISSVASQQRAYAADTLIHDRISPRVYQTMRASAEAVCRLMALVVRRKPALRVLIAHGKQDPIAKVESVSVVRRFLESNLPEVVSRFHFHIYPNCCHEIHHDWCHNEFIEDVIRFVRAGYENI